MRILRLNCLRHMIAVCGILLGILLAYLLYSGGNDHATRFWCRNRPGNQARDKYNAFHAQGYGDQNAPFGCRAMSGYPKPEAPRTPGAFAVGLSRNEGNIPAFGVAMPLSAQSLNGSGQDPRFPEFRSAEHLLFPPIPTHLFWLLGSSKLINRLLSKCLNSSSSSFRRLDSRWSICHFLF